MYLRACEPKEAPGTKCYLIWTQSDCSATSKTQHLEHKPTASLNPQSPRQTNLLAAQTYTEKKKSDFPRPQNRGLFFFPMIIISWECYFILNQTGFVYLPICIGSIKLIAEHLSNCPNLQHQNTATFTTSFTCLIFKGPCQPN